MSGREKRLLFFLLVVGFIVVNAAVVKLYYMPKLKEARSREISMENAYKQGLIDLEDQEDKQEEIDWLLKYQKEPQAAQKAESQLEQLAKSEADRRGLTVKRRKPLTAIADPVLHYHRARVEMEVSGREQVLYQWIDRLNSPADFRAVTMMRLNPKRDDDTVVDCLVVIESWFEPKTDT